MMLNLILSVALALCALPALGSCGNQDANCPPAQHSAKEIIDKLGLVSNPEKGYYIETFRDPAIIPGNADNRTFSTAIYYLLEGSASQSLWHRLDAAEAWHWYAGSPLTLYLSSNNGTGIREEVLGPDIFAQDGQRPQIVIATGMWQSARSLGSWTLVGTSVAPAFVESGSEIKPEGWQPS